MIGDWQKILERSQNQFRNPDLFVFLDINPKISLSRLTERKRTSTFESVNYLLKVYKIYKLIIEGKLFDNILLLDATKDIDDLESITLEKIAKITKNKDF